MDVRLLIEALRGGNNAGSGAANVRRYPDGTVVKNPQSNSSAKNFMPTGLRGYQLHNAEAAATGTKGKTYAEWLRGKGD